MAAGKGWSISYHKTFCADGDPWQNTSQFLKVVIAFAGSAHAFLRMGVGRAVCPFRSVLRFCARFAFEFVIVLVWKAAFFIPHRTFPHLQLLVLVANTYFYYEDVLPSYDFKLLA